MGKKFKVIILETKGLRVKGDDHSSYLADLLSQNLNSHSQDGWQLEFITPSMTSDGNLVKMMVTLSRDSKNNS